MMLLRPCELTDQTYRYLLGYYGSLYGMELHAAALMANHHHPVATDTRGEYPDFFRLLHAQMSWAIHRIHGLEGQLWDGNQTSVVVCEDVGGVVSQVSYAVANPVKHGAVGRVELWPGVVHGPQDWGKPMAVKRPDVVRGKNLPDEVELCFTAPPMLRDMDIEQARDHVQGYVDKRVEDAKRARGGKPFMGYKAVLKMDPFSIPETVRSERLRNEKRPEGRRGAANRRSKKVNPTFAASSPEGRKHAAARLVAFRICHRDAYKKWEREGEALFPPGTWLMASRKGVNIETWDGLPQDVREQLEAARDGASATCEDAAPNQRARRRAKWDAQGEQPKRRSRSAKHSVKHHAQQTALESSLNACDIDYEPPQGRAPPTAP